MLAIDHIRLITASANPTDHYIVEVPTDKLYEGHIPISPLQRTILAVGSAFTALANPLRGGKYLYKFHTTYDTPSYSPAIDTSLTDPPLFSLSLPVDMVAALGETTSGIFLNRIRDQMLQDPEGRRILRERPVITSETMQLDTLRQLSDGSFGREYVRFLDDQQVSPDTREPVRYTVSFLSAFTSFLTFFSPDKNDLSIQIDFL